MVTPGNALIWSVSWRMPSRNRQAVSSRAKCSPGQACNSNADCLNGICSAGFCAMAACNDNLKNALKEIQFPDEHVHDALNIFMTTGCDDQHRLFYVDPEARKGDYVELYAEIDLVCAVSCCPGASSGSEPRGTGAGRLGVDDEISRHAQ